MFNEIPANKSFRPLSGANTTLNGFYEISKSDEKWCINFEENTCRVCLIIDVASLFPRNYKNLLDKKLRQE